MDDSDYKAEMEHEEYIHDLKKEELRKKILDDIDALNIDDVHAFTRRNIKTVVKSIVNKRFDEI